MGDTSEYKENGTKKHICLGILAHADAGKTTLSECMLYKSGVVRQPGRVDHRDAFLDIYDMEKERGITIFSKQAIFSWKGLDITLVDTPGHVDFSAETERTLQVLDYAVLVISGADGVQGHTMTLWNLLRRYQIPVFVFVNKMDQEGTDKKDTLRELESRFGEGCVDFTGLSAPGQMDETAMENLALCDEKLMERYLETGAIDTPALREAIRFRKVFPCYFGSALYMEGVEDLMDGIADLAEDISYPAEFGAKVYKITRDPQGVRLTHLKVTGGALRVKDTIRELEEKVNEIRLYSGAKYRTEREIGAGRVCAVAGFTKTYPGQGLGRESASDMPVLEPVLTYQILLPQECDVHKMLADLRTLEEEEPELHILWEEQTGEIHVQLMGEVQLEILKQLVWERFQVSIDFTEGSIVYKETIQEPVEGIGHFEPLRHYAEVHLLLEPAERGTGLQFASACGEDILDRNWQRLILTHLEEKEHRGVLTGSLITDMKITLLGGRAHLKHTEGGDFRQATYRAVRQGLKKARSVLLEPYYTFRMEVPAENVGRAMADIQRMHGSAQLVETTGETAVLKGSAPVSSMGGYPIEFTAYTKGKGRLFCELKGYEPCHDQEEVINALGYDSEADLENPTGSVFCAHGAGYVVPWYEVDARAHMGNLYEGEKKEQSGENAVSFSRGFGSQIELTPEELEAIYVKTPDPIRRDYRTAPLTVEAGEKREDRGKWKKEREKEEEYLLVDGYNILFAWEDLSVLAEENLEAARGRLADLLCNYQGYRKCTVILVFDAYKVEGNPGEVIKYHNIYIVYTKEAETADQYIEKTVRRIGKHHSVTVATSDALEQVIILSQGAGRLSAAGLREELERTAEEMRAEYLRAGAQERNYLFDYLDQDLAEKMEEIRTDRNQKKAEKL